MHFNQQGFSLIGVIIGLALTLVLSATLTKQISVSFRSQHRLHQLSDFEAIKRTIFSSISCEETLRVAGLGPNPPADMCQSSSLNQRPPYFNLQRHSSFGYHPLSPGKQNIDGSYSVGNYLVRASCSAAEGSIIVQAIPRNKKNSMSKNKISWNTKESLMIGSGRPLCFEKGGGALELAQGVLTQTDFSIIRGPSEAFVRLTGVEPSVFDISGKRGDGIRCNEDQGWLLSGCYMHSIETHPDISPLANGCISFDTERGSLTVMCMRKSS